MWESHTIKYAFATLAVWNAAVFLLYGVDKRRARRGDRRVSEKTLLLTAAFMGGVGALLGMYTFRHKTKHLKFKIGVPLLFAMNIAVAVAVYRLLSTFYETNVSYLPNGLAALFLSWYTKD